jgi:hypothetical protein
VEHPGYWPADPGSVGKPGDFVTGEPFTGGVFSENRIVDFSAGANRGRATSNLLGTLM